MKVDWNVPWVYSSDVEDLNAKVENWNGNVNICGKQKTIWTLLPPTEKEKKSQAKKKLFIFWHPKNQLRGLTLHKTIFIAIKDAQSLIVIDLLLNHD